VVESVLLPAFVDLAGLEPGDGAADGLGGGAGDGSGGLGWTRVGVSSAAREACRGTRATYIRCSAL